MTSIEPINLTDTVHLDTWFKRFSLYVITNEKITDQNKNAFYLTLIGKEAFNLLIDLIYPVEIAQQTVEVLHATLKGHLLSAQNSTTSFEIRSRCFATSCYDYSIKRRTVLNFHEVCGGPHNKSFFIVGCEEDATRLMPAGVNQLLLILAGDVETNPGPMDCQECGRSMRQGQDGVQCASNEHTKNAPRIKP